MAISGERFLAVSRAESFTVTAHALNRLEEYTGVAPTSGLAQVFFARSRQLRVDELRLLGYRPAYERRATRGIRSWYFRFVVFGQELIAVVSEGKAAGALAWVTTYAPNAQSDIFRIHGLESCAAA